MEEKRECGFVGSCCNKMTFSKDTKIILCLWLLCLILISIWFKDGELLATGEEGLILNNPLRNIQLFSYSWNEIGAGVAIPGSNATVPFFHVQLWFLNIGVPTWIFQASLFFLLLFVGSVSMYYLCKELFEKKLPEKIVQIGLISSIFYILNPISLLGVWTRFLLPFMFFYALLPLFLLLFIRGLHHKRKIYIIIAPLISLVFSFAFAAPSLILLLWVLPFLYCLALKKFYPFVHFGLTFLFWVLVSLWWIVPFVELSQTAFASETEIEHAIGTLKANSADFTLVNVIRLIHGGLLYRGELYGSVYKTLPFIIISFITPVMVFLGFFLLRDRKNKLFFGGSLLLLLFLVKGTSAPFGDVFLWFFSNITFLQVYRNPLEKIGLLLPVVFAPLFSLGLVYLTSKIGNPLLKKLLPVFAVISMIIFNWPFFTGAIIHFGTRDIRVEVPSSFEKANQAIGGGEHRIFSLPQMEGGTGIYNWKYRYLGVESSEFLFEYPTIVKFFDAKSFFGQTIVGIAKGKVDSNLEGVMQLFSADLVAYRKDTDVKSFGYNLDALERSRRMIENSSVNKVYDSLEVSIFSLPKEKITHLIYTPKSIKQGSSALDLLNLLEKKKINFNEEVFLDREVSIEAIPEKIEFTKKSPVKYDIKIEGSKGRFILVFNSNYHPGWKIKLSDEEIPEQSHIIANGYANGFIVEEKGDFEMSLEFAPEERIRSYYLISLATIAFGLSVVFGKSLLYALRLKRGK